MEEIWKDIEGYEGLYQVSNLGRVKSLGREREQGKGNYYRKEKLLKNGFIWNGYETVSLSKNGKVKRKLVHRLVAQAFIPNPENKPQVNHKDGNKQNNQISNLEWNTPSENQIHAHVTGLKHSVSHPGIKGVENYRSVVIEQYDLYQNKLRTWYGINEAARNTKISAQNIWSVCQGRRKSAGGYIWRYANA